MVPNTELPASIERAVNHTSLSDTCKPDEQVNSRRKFMKDCLQGMIAYALFVATA